MRTFLRIWRSDRNRCGNLYLPYDITSRHELQLIDTGTVRGEAVIKPDRDYFLYAARRLAAKDRNGLADPEDIAIELGIGLYEVTELVRRYQDSFDWASVPIGKLRPR